MNELSTIDTANRQKATPAHDRVEEYFVRKSLFICIARIVILYGMYLAYYLILTSAFYLVDDILLKFIIGIIEVCSIFGVIIMSIYIYNRWKSHFYTILPHSIIETKGVFIKFEKSYSCHRIESVLMYKPLLGKIFDFGSISLYDPFLKQRIHLTNIDHPDIVTEILKQIYVIDDEERSSDTADDIEKSIIGDEIHSKDHSKNIKKPTSSSKP